MPWIGAFIASLRTVMHAVAAPPRERLAVDVAFLFELVENVLVILGDVRVKFKELVDEILGFVGGYDYAIVLERVGQ